MPLSSSSAAELPLPLLITGISGVAGYNAFYQLRAKYPGQVFGLRQVDNWRLAGDGVLAANAEDRDKLERLFDRCQFRSVLNCAGNCALKSCELDPDMAWRINVDGVRNLLDVVAHRPVRLVHLSIDLVFSGTQSGLRRESDEVDPVTVYGATMAAGERLVLERDSSACVLRISLPMGVSFNGHAGAIDWIQSRFKHHRPATLYFDEVRTPTYTDCLTDLFEAALASNLSGLYHSGGPRALSLYEIAQVINCVGGYDPRLLIGCPRAQAGPIPPRAGNVAMDSSRLQAALPGIVLHPWPYSEPFVPTRREWHFERAGDWQGSPELLARILYANPLRPATQRPPASRHHRSQARGSHRVSSAES